MGWIIMEPKHTPPMSGSNSLCVATVLLDAGIVPMQEPETRFTMEARAVGRCCGDLFGGKAQSVRVTNHPSFAQHLDRRSRSKALARSRSIRPMAGTVSCLSMPTRLAFAHRRRGTRELSETGMKITKAANEQIGFTHPANPDWSHISFCQFTMPVTEEDGVKTGRNAVAIEPGKIDRSPTGTGCSARMAVLHARGELAVGRNALLAFRSSDSRFNCRIEAETDLAGTPAIIPSISGRAWITETKQLMLDPSDPWPEGYRVGDTWPGL
jgi:proline racemase